MKKLEEDDNCFPKNILEMMDINPVLDKVDFDLNNKVLMIKKSKNEK